MTIRTTLNITLPSELEEFVLSQVASGRYESPSEVVRESLRLPAVPESRREAALGDLRRKIAVGLEQARRGELLDGEEVFRELLGPDGA